MAIPNLGVFAETTNEVNGCVASYLDLHVD